MKRAHSLSAKEIPLVLKSSQKYSSECFYVRFRKNSVGKPKIAFVASKKEFKKAVQRNLAKRRIREAFTPLALNIPPVEAVVFIQKNSLDINFENLKEQAEKFVEYLKSNYLKKAQ